MIHERLYLYNVINFKYTKDLLNFLLVSTAAKSSMTWSQSSKGLDFDCNKVQMISYVVSESGLTKDHVDWKFFSKFTESRSICFGSKTPKIASFTMKISFYLRCDVIFEISNPKKWYIQKIYCSTLKYDQ